MTEAWREQVRNLAREKAAEEARLSWDTVSGESIPFDYRWEHVQSVVKLALELGRELSADLEVVEAAAWLHDIRKLEADHAKAGAGAAAAILAVSDFPAAKISQVVQAIHQHEGLVRDEGAPPLQPLEAAILWDADKLSKIGVSALFFAAGLPRYSGRSQSDRLDELESFTLRVLAQTVHSMNTAPARRRARERYVRMTQVLTYWRQEMEE